LTRGVEVLFQLRRQIWDERFEFQNFVVVGKSPCGRATVRVLAMNTRVRVDLRRETRASDCE
jgi:hypothetical protein